MIDVTVGRAKFVVDGDEVMGYSSMEDAIIADLWKAIRRMALHINVRPDTTYLVTDGVLYEDDEEDHLAIAALREAKRAGGI